MRCCRPSSDAVILSEAEGLSEASALRIRVILSEAEGLSEARSTLVILSEAEGLSEARSTLVILSEAAAGAQSKDEGRSGEGALLLSS